MSEWGVNFLRLPLGYWNVIDMPGSPDAPEAEAARMANLSTIMPSHESYRPYIDKILKWSYENDIYVMLDLHAAPGN
jgi:aryl-phospho-beta-D-glucosidase BglC (GH1 family)